MASYGEGFAGGMGQGMAMGKMLLDTYRDSKQRREMEEASELNQQEVSTLTKDQQATADYVNNADNGYEVQKTDGGGLKYRTAGSENSWTDLTPGAKQYKLGDKTQDTAFTDDQVSRHRANAQADVYARNGDPGKAYGLRAAAREDRAGSTMEAARDEYTAGLEDFAAGRNMDKYMPMILKSYNDARPGSKYDDKHHATYDPERNVVAFSNKDGQIVNTIPVNQQTLASAWKERYLDKIEALDPKLGLERDKSKETSRHNMATENIYKEKNDIDSRRNGILAATSQSKNPATALNDKINTMATLYMEADETGKLTQQQARKRAAQVLTRDPELKDTGAQVEYDDGNGLKIKGTASQVHNARLERDPAYKAGAGSNLAMKPPAARQAPNQTGKTAVPQSSGASDAELDTMISDAARGGKTGITYLQQALTSGELNMNQRQRVEKALNSR